MPRETKSEIRDSQIRDLLQKVSKLKYGKYLKRLNIDKARAFQKQTVEFDFPVTALIGTNGGGKTTVLGAAAIAYKSIKPRIFFPKSSVGDNSMANWSIGYEITDKAKNPQSQFITRSTKFTNLRWDRNDVLDRNVIHFGIMRTVPASERAEFKNIGSANYKFSGTLATISHEVAGQVAKILGKDVSNFQRADIDKNKSFYVGGDGTLTYSEFHFGAGEASVIRMVAEIEAAEENSLVLIEEIENGLHPVAVRRMVEYLIEVASRKSIQTIFTTHSDVAISCLPDEAIWSAIDGTVRQGAISISSLRAITGRIDERAAIFVEDQFAKLWVDSLLRHALPDQSDEIAVYLVSGDSKAHSIHASHRRNPAVNGRLISICVLDGDSSVEEDNDNGIFKLPGRVPESEVFGHVRSNIATLAMKLKFAMHIPEFPDERLAAVVEEVGNTNRDPHLLFSQVGDKAGLVPTALTASAFTSLWIADHPAEVQKFAAFIEKMTVLDSAT